MEYERIEKAREEISILLQTGMISQSKLRMKLMESLNLRKEGGSRRTSPSKMNESDFVKTGLLDSEDHEFKDGVTEVETAPAIRKNEVSMENGSASKGDGGRVSYPGRFMEDQNLDYDSNASSSSFEFHRGERSFVHHLARSGSRHKSSKWNDAEKWIMSKHQNASASYWKKSLLQSHTNRIAVTSSVKIIPDHSGGDTRPPVAARRMDSAHPVEELSSERFAFGPTGTACSYLGHNSEDGNSRARNRRDARAESATEESSSGITTIREVSMRDMGTEMTPATSPEPSRTVTPGGTATPRDEEAKYPGEFCNRELAEEELKLKTKREIVALGVQLGKMNIAAWASKQESEKKNVSIVDAAEMEELERLACERRAAAWEEAERTRHIAWYKREEIRIQAWEIQQKATLEAEMRKMEARVDQMRAQGQAKVVQKIAMTRQKSEEKRAAAVARKKRDAERTAAKGEYIRQTGRIPSSPHRCCGILC